MSKELREIEVSAIMEAYGPLLPLAISPDGEHIYAYRAFYKQWSEVFPSHMTALAHWGMRMQYSRKIRRGIFRIKVAENV